MPIVPMTGKSEDSLYPEPEEQKIEINPLSYLNTPDTATEAEFAVAVDELAKMSPFGIRETGDYSQFGADNAKDAFFNLRKAILHGIESLSDDESRAWFETDPEDIETRYRIASENLPPSQRASLFAGEVVGGIDDMPILSEAEYKVAPPEVREASDRLKVQSGQATDVEAAWDRRPGRDMMRGDFPTITPGFASWDTPPPLPDDADFSGIISQWRDRYNKERTISAYSARIDAKNTLRKWAMMKPLLSDEADSLLQHIMADKPRDDEFDAKFMALPEEQQEVVMMLGRDLRNTPDKNMLRDSMTEFMIGGMRLFGDAAKEVRDLWMMAETDREDFQKQAEVKARMQELWAPKRSQEYGYWEDAIIGTIGSLPYTGFTMATTMAGVPEVGLGVISLSMAHRFKQQIALQGGDVTDPKVLVLAQAAGIAYWGIEQAQVGTWMKSMTDLERRMATANFAHGIWTGYVKFLGKAEAKAKARKGLREAAPKLASYFIGDLLKEWLYEEETQDLIEEGFVSWGIGEDVARNMAEQAVESLQQNFGTMLLMTAGFSGIGAARTGLSRKHTDQELFDAMHHRAQLVGSLHQRNELREKLRKGEDIDRRQLAKLEKDIDYQRRVLSTFHRAFNKAGGMEDAESAFQRMGLDPRQSFLAAYMFDQERRSIMGDPDLTQAEKEELIGKQATSLSLLKQAYPNRTFTENPDGTFTSSYTINGNEVREIHQTGTIEYDPASPEGATSTVNAINAAEKAARLSGAPFSDNMKGMTEERWLDLTPEARNEIVQALDLRPEGNFIFTAKMAGSPDVAQVDEKQIRHLSGEITLAPDAAPSATFHEDLHAFVRYLRETGELTPQDIQKLREEFGDPRKGVNEDFNEENAAETIRKMQSRSVRHVESTGAEAIMDKVYDVLDRIDLFRRRRKQAETVAENLLGQMRRGEWTGIPVGTITEAQRQKNAQMRKKSRAKPKKQAKKPQEPTAKKPEQAQEPSEAEIQPEGQATEKPTSQAEITPQGEGQTAEEAAAAAEADEIGAGETGEVDADQPLGKGMGRAMTPHKPVVVEYEWQVRDAFRGIITSRDPGYDQRYQRRDRETLASRIQEHKISRELAFEKVSDSNMTDTGAPMLDDKSQDISGNVRVFGIRKAILEDTGVYPAYAARVRRRAAELGIVIPTEIEFPVLVRVITRIVTPNVTMEEIADLSNREDKLQMSAAETAQADAKLILENGLLRLFQPGRNGNILAVQNHGFITAFVSATGASQLLKSDGSPTSEAKERIQRAMLALLVGDGQNAKETIRALIENSEGIEKQIRAITRAAPDIVAVAQDRPEYSLTSEIGALLHDYMNMQAEGSSPYQMVLGRPPIVDMLMRALWERRNRIDDIQSMFSDYAARARNIATETGKLMDIPDSTKEELLAAAIEATKPVLKPGEQSEADETAETEAPTPEPPPPTQEQRAIEKKGAAPTATGQELRDAIAAQATPEPAKYDPEPNAPPMTGDMKEALPGMDELRFWRETPTLPMSSNPDVLGAAKILPYMLAGNKSHIYAHHHDMFEAVVQGAPAFVDCFDGAATYLYNLANAGVLPDNSTWNEWEYTRHVTTKQIKENPEGVIAALDALSDRLEQAIPPGSRVGAEIDATRDAIIDWLNAELRGEHGIAYVPAENAEDAEGRTILLDTPESAALYLLVQNISYSSRAQDVSMYDGKPTWTTAGDDAKLHPTDGKLLTLVDAKGKWRPSFRLAYPADIIRKASKNLQNVNVTQRDGWSLASDLDVAPDGAVVAIDTSYFGAQNYGLKTREDGDMDTWLAKVRKHLLPHVDRLTFIITNNWNFHAVNELQKMGFLVARTERAGESPELVAMSGRARHIIAPAIRTVDYLGQKVKQEGGEQARLSVSAKGRKALTTGVYKDGSAEVLADLARLPASLKPYVAKYDDADELINLSGFAGWKPGPKVAPPHIWPYRPAVRLADGSIAWHPRARMHSEALSMWLKQQDIPLDAFDIDEYYGDGGLGPDGRYYEKAYIGDGVSDFVEGRETGRFSVQARQPAPAFYSQLRRVIEQKVPNRATVAQVRATIDPAKGSGVKADEIFWSGLQEFLDGKKPTDMVTKEEVLAATREVVVRDVVKGTAAEGTITPEERVSLSDAGSPKFANYVLPGGENYRELLLTLPVEKFPTFEQWLKENYAISSDNLTDSRRRLLETKYRNLPDLPSPFTSGHFSEPNIVAHVRFNERTSADGKRTLFIEEIQSDWAQKGREEGFGGEWRVEDIDAHPNDRNIATFKSQEAAEAAAENYREADDSGHRIVVIEESAGVPSAPYVTKTDAWVSLALKRMVRLAAENGFEQVAWTTGIQQVSRYEESMRKVVDRIEWTKPFPSGNRGVVAIKNGAEVLNADVDKDGKVTAASHGDAIGKQLGEVVGKTLAERIMSETRNGSAEGKDLTIGGEGMKGFYDQIVPTTANKLFKRFGAKVGEAWFDLGDPENAVAPPPDDMVDEGGFTAHALPITPALRDSVLYEGQARFSVKANAPSSTAQDAEYMAAVERGDMETAQRIVDEAADRAGYRIVRYHQTSQEARAKIYREGFRIDKPRARLSDEHVPDAIFFKADPSDIGVGAADDSAQIKVRLSYSNPIGFYDRNEMEAWFRKNPKYAEVIDELRFYDREQSVIFDKKWDELRKTDLKTRDEYRAKKLDLELHAHLERWKDEIDRLATRARAIITGMLRSQGYDAVIIQNDQGSFGRKVATTAVFDPNQIKSADAITRDDTGRIIPPSERFNPERDDIRFSVKANAPSSTAQDAEYMAAVERGDMETAQRIVDEAFATSAIAELSRYFDFAQNHPIRKSDPKLAHNKAISSYVSAIRRLYDGLVEMSGNKPNGNILEIGRLVELSEDSFARGDIGKAIQYGEMALQEYHIDAYDSTWRTDYTSKLFSEIEPAIVRDDKGRVIPPSERFNPKSDDIRYSVRARAPLFGNNNRAIASLAVQYLMGEKLDTERAEKAMYLFAASGTTPDQMIADAKKLAESKVAQEAKKHIENRDPNAAHRVMSQQAEYDSIVAFRTGMKSGLKMGQEAERAKQSAEKKLLLNARGEDLQQFIIDTGIDWTETLLSSLPEAFAEWEKASKEAEEKAKAEGAPEGPQKVPEPPPADPAELEARDRRMRELVAATRAWGDAERAKREKEADDRRKKEQERIEKGESGEEADDTDADPGGEQAEGMEPEGLAIPKELLQAHGVDIRNAQEVAHLIRIWMADWLVRQSKGRLTHQTVWKDREAVEKYRKTMVSQLRDMANGMVEQGWSMTVIHNRISDIPSTARPDTIERRTASIVAMIQAHSIRQTRAQLIADIRKNIKKKAIKGKRHDALNEDLERKINSEQELTARYLRRILTWSPEKVDAEIVAIHTRLKERTELYSEQNPYVNIALDVEFHRDLMRLRVLQEWGGLKRMLPAQIKQAGIAIDGWLVSAQERLYRRWWAMEELIGKLVTALNEGIVPDDPEQARIQVSRISGWIKDNIATVRQRLEGLIRQQHDPIKRQAAQAAIDEIMFILSRGTEIYRTVAHEYRQAFVEAVIDIAGGKNAAMAYMKHLEEEIPIEVAEQVSRQGYDGRGGGRVMTYNQALQLYASITQRGFASNVKLHKREEHAALLEGIFTTEDLALIVRLREIYEERRGRLSEVVQEVSGMLVWRPDPLYMHVRVKMPKKGGFQSKGDSSTWMPLARSLTPRVHHGLDFDEGATLTGTFYDAAEDAARAIGFGTRGLILRGVLGNSTIQESADRYYGGGEMADLNQQVVQALDGFGRTDQDSTHGMLRTIRELNAYAALSWNPLAAPQQTVSFPVFAMVLDGGFGQVLSAIKDFDRDAMREIMESDGFKARYQGGFMPEVAEILADGRSNIIARFYKLGMTIVQIGDFVPTLMVAPGLYKARLAQNIDAGMDEATAKERAMTWTWEMIEASQQTSRAEMLPKFYRQTGAGSEAMKLILQFSSAPLLQLSHEYHAWRDAMAGVDGAWKRLGRAVLVNHIIIPQMMEMVKKMFYWLIGRDEPEDQQLFWTILNGVTVGAVNRIMIIGILAETAYNAIVDGKIRYGGQMVPAESLYRTAAYALRAFLHDPFDPEDGMDAFQSDIVKALEGMLAPFRYGKEFYDNRIAQ